MTDSAADYYEEDEVVYKEDCELYEEDENDHHEFLMMSQTQPSQTQHHHHHHHYPQRAAASRRHHHQRWNNNQEEPIGEEYHDDNYSLSDSNADGEGREEGDEEEENPFLALDALVRQHQINQQQQQQQQQQPQANNANGAAAEVPFVNEQSDTVEAVHRGEEVEVSSPPEEGAAVATASSNNLHHDDSNMPEPKQPLSRLPTTMTTQEADRNEAGVVGAGDGPVPSSSSLLPGTTTGRKSAAELLSSRSNSNWLDNGGNQNKKPDTTASLSVLEASRRFVAKKKQRRRADNRHKSQQPPTKKSRVEKPVGVVRSKLSIVGSRPKHWGSQKAKTLLNSSFGKFTNTQRSHVQSELARAEDARKRMAQKNPSLSTTDDANPAVRQEGTSTPMSSNKADSAAPAAAAAAVTFAPSFLKSRSAPAAATAAARAEDDVEDNDDAQADFRSIHQQDMMSPHGRHPPAFASPTPPRRGSSCRKQYRGRNGGGSGGGAGPLLKRLRQIRESIKGDAIRFQSGQYPFKTASLDLNDPRNRAKSYMDVTILGESIPWEKEYQKLTFLGYVHAHHHKNQARSVNASTPSTTEESPGPKSCLAWMCFTFDTAREKNLQAGTNLRIYNPVAFPLESAPTVAEPDSSSSSAAQPEASTDKQQQPSRSVVGWMVVSTEVCEHYPDCLPKLPDRETLSAQLNISALI